MCAVVNRVAEYIVAVILVNRAVHSLNVTVILLFERLKLHKTFSENGSPRRTRHIFHSHIVVHVNLYHAPAASRTISEPKTQYDNDDEF